MWCEHTQHVLDLPPHGKHHKYQPVHHQNRPEDRKVGQFGPGAYETDTYSSSRTVPELELW